MGDSDRTEGLGTREGLAIGITLFSMFFGAGNLILPPLLGVQAQSQTPLAMLGFLVAGIGLPVLGIVSVARAGDLSRLAGRVHPAFGAVFAALIYLAIGPCLAIPRTSSTSFEMLVPLLPAGVDPNVARVGFSLAFFAVALALAMRPGRLSRFMGRVSGPALVALIVVLVGSALLRGLGEVGPATAPYDGNATLGGFLTGYQTMDLLASLTFGLVIAENVRDLGVTSEAGVTREIGRAGLLMGVLMALVYCGLAYVGVAVAPGHPGLTNGAAALVASAGETLGVAGTVLVAAIFLVACLNVCCGLVSCCATYFSEAVPRVGYRAWAVGFAAFSCAVSTLGLDAIIAFSGPLLGVLYPPAIVLVLMGLARRTFDGCPLCWPLGVGTATLLSLASALATTLAPGTWTPLDLLPLSAQGLGWVLPTALALLAGAAAEPLRRRAVARQAA